MKKYGKWRYSSTILDPTLNRGEWSNSRPDCLDPWGKSLRYRLDRKLGGPQKESGRCGVEKNCFPCRESSPGRLSHIPSLQGQVSPISFLSKSRRWNVIRMFRRSSSGKLSCSLAEVCRCLKEICCLHLDIHDVTSQKRYISSVHVICRLSRYSVPQFT
jgi:hypothetical protein